MNMLTYLCHISGKIKLLSIGKRLHNEESSYDFDFNSSFFPGALGLDIIFNSTLKVNLPNSLCP